MKQPGRPKQPDSRRILICKVCKTEKEVYKRSNKIFCSRLCATLGQYRHGPLPKRRKCKQCDKPIQKIRGPETPYCCKRCEITYERYQAGFKDAEKLLKCG